MSILKVTQDKFKQKIVITNEPFFNGAVYSIFEDEKRVRATAHTTGAYPYLKDSHGNVYLIATSS